MSFSAICGKGVCAAILRCWQMRFLNCMHHSLGLSSCSTQRVHIHSLTRMGMNIARPRRNFLRYFTTFNRCKAIRDAATVRCLTGTSVERAAVMKVLKIGRVRAQAPSQ